MRVAVRSDYDQGTLYTYIKVSKNKYDEANLKEVKRSIYECRGAHAKP